MNKLLRIHKEFFTMRVFEWSLDDRRQKNRLRWNNVEKQASFSSPSHEKPVKKHNFLRRSVCNVQNRTCLFLRRFFSLRVFEWALAIQLIVSGIHRSERRCKYKTFEFQTTNRDILGETNGTKQPIFFTWSHCYERSIGPLDDHKATSSLWENTFRKNATKTLGI